MGRPQVFSLANDKDVITLKMIPTADCVIHVLGPDQQPLAGATCGFWPNVHWWTGSSQYYCYPLVSTLEGLIDPKRAKDLVQQANFDMFSAKTDVTGRAVVKNLPPEESIFTIHHDKFELPVDDTVSACSRRLAGRT